MVRTTGRSSARRAAVLMHRKSRAGYGAAQRTRVFVGSFRTSGLVAANTEARVWREWELVVLLLLLFLAIVQAERSR